jgi:membrane protease YdiL (CAAX protease family)
VIVEESRPSENPINEVPEARETAPPGVVAKIFRNRFGHWRAGWRLATYAIVVFVVGKSMTTVLKLFFTSPSEAPFASWHHSMLWVVTNIALIVGAFIVLRWIDRRPLALLGLDFGAGCIRETAAGLAAGVGSTGLLVGALVISGSVSLAIAPDLGQSMSVMPRFLFIFTMAAAVEELVFRGYPLQVFSEGSRRWSAGSLLCFFFTWGHGGNPDVTVVGIINIFLAAVMLTVLYFQTRRLWLPIALHLSWNFAQSWLWGFDVSGIKIEGQFFVVTQHGSDLVTGGEFGLEGSILSTILFGSIIVWFLARPIIRPTVDVAALWARYPAGFGMDPELPHEEEQGSRGAEEQAGVDTPADEQGREGAGEQG